MNKYVLTINGWDRYDVFGFKSDGALVDVQEELARALKEERQAYASGTALLTGTGEDIILTTLKLKSILGMIIGFIFRSREDSDGVKA